MRILIILAILLTTKSYAQTAKVLYVSGLVKIKSSGARLTKGNHFQISDELAFSKSTDTLVVLIKGKGIGVWEPSHTTKDAKAGNTELYSVIRDFVWYKTVDDYFKGRDGEINTFYDLANYFRQWKTEQHLLILDTLLISVNPILTKQIGKGFLYLQYLHNEETINKKLAIDTLKKQRHYLVLDTALLKIDGQQVYKQLDKTVSLFFFNKDTKESKLIISFNVDVMEFGSLKNDICAAMETSDDWVTVYDFLKYRWGECNTDQLKKQLKIIKCTL